MEDDPRDELVARLIEYRKYKEAAISLKESADERIGSFYKNSGDLAQFGEVVAVGTEDKFERIRPYRSISKNAWIESV